MKKNLPDIIDLAVIGAGLAGLSCAVRGRFVKSAGSYSMSTVLFDASEASGGLAALGNIKITGPGFSMPGKDVVAKLLDDIDEYDIPLVRTAVSKITRNKNTGHFLMETSDGSVYTSRTVALCSGMRKLSNEISYFGKGVKITYMGYDFIASTITAEIERLHKRKFMIYGNEYSKNLIDVVISALVTNNIDIKTAGPIFLLNTDAESFEKERCFKKYSNLFKFGVIKKFKGAGKLEAVECVLDGKGFEIELDSLLLDYNSFEIKPDVSYKVFSSKIVFDERGFIAVDRDMQTSVRGLYAAGDITGSYFCASRAISEGVVAGFSAYREVMAQKGVKDYSLFAYKADNRIVRDDYREINAAHLKKALIVLAGEKKIAGYFEEIKALKKEQIKKILNIFGLYYIISFDKHEEIKRILNACDTDLYEMLSDMTNRKLITIA